MSKKCTCANCANAIFIRNKGAYKCIPRKHTIPDINWGEECEYYEEGTPETVDK